MRSMALYCDWTTDFRGSRASGEAASAAQYAVPRVRQDEETSSSSILHLLCPRHLVMKLRRQVSLSRDSRTRACLQRPSCFGFQRLLASSTRDDAFIATFAQCFSNHRADFSVANFAGSCKLGDLSLVFQLSGVVVEVLTNFSRSLPSMPASWWQDHRCSCTRLTNVAYMPSSERWPVREPWFRSSCRSRLAFEGERESYAF